jgi:gliding motility-associated lipoprotein GldH
MMEWRHLLFLLLCSGAMCWMGGCTRPVALHTYHSVAPEGWNAHEVMSFPVDTLRHEGDYRLRVGLRITEMFPFRSIWLQVAQEWDDPELMRMDTIECKLTDEAGDFNGNGVSLYQYTFPVGVFHLEKGLKGRIHVRHLMRRELLPGVSDVGILLDEVVKNESYLR